MLVFNIRYVFDNLYTQFWLSIFFSSENRVLYPLVVFDSKVYVCNKFLTKYPPDHEWDLLQRRVIPLKTDGDLVVN